MPGNAKIDGNYRRSILGVLDDVSQLTQPVLVNPVTKRLLVSAVVTSNNTGIGNTIPGGTVGSVLFLGIGSTLAQDNANFFYDNVQHFLGIGNNTPNANLHVSGSVQFDLGSDAAGDIYYRDSSGNLARLPIGVSGQQLTVVGGLPAWSAASAVGYDTIQNQGTSVTQRSIINLTNLLTASDVGGKTQLTINTTNLANDSTFISTITANTTFLTNIANSATFVNALIANTTFTTNLANNANFYNTLANNTSFITALTSNSTFQTAVTNIVNNPSLNPDAGKVFVDNTDTRLGYLADKLVAGSNITLTVLGAPGNEQIQIDATGGGGSIDVQYNGLTIVTGAMKLNFHGNASVVDEGSGVAGITILDGIGLSSGESFIIDNSIPITSNPAGSDPTTGRYYISAPNKQTFNVWYKNPYGTWEIERTVTPPVGVSTGGTATIYGFCTDATYLYVITYASSGSNYEVDVTRYNLDGTSPSVAVVITTGTTGTTGWKPYSTQNGSPSAPLILAACTIKSSVMYIRAFYWNAGSNQYDTATILRFTISGITYTQGTNITNLTNLAINGASMIFDGTNFYFGGYSNDTFTVGKNVGKYALSGNTVSEVGTNSYPTIVRGADYGSLGSNFTNIVTMSTDGVSMNLGTYSLERYFYGGSNSYTKMSFYGGDKFALF